VPPGGGVLLDFSFPVKSKDEAAESTVLDNFNSLSILGRTSGRAYVDETEHYQAPKSGVYQCSNPSVHTQPAPYPYGFEYGGYGYTPLPYIPGFPQMAIGYPSGGQYGAPTVGFAFPKQIAYPHVTN